MSYFSRQQIVEVEFENVGKREITLTQVMLFPTHGGIIDERVRQLVQIANTLQKPVVHEFNGTFIAAYPGDDPVKLLEKWEKKSKN